MKTITNAKSAHKMWSVRLSAIAGACAIAQMLLPAWEGIIPANLFSLLSALAATGAIIGRVLKQEGLGDND